MNRYKEMVLIIIEIKMIINAKFYRNKRMNGKIKSPTILYGVGLV